MDLESIVLSEVTYSQKNKIACFSSWEFYSSWEQIHGIYSVNRGICGYSINEERTGNTILWYEKGYKSSP